MKKVIISIKGINKPEGGEKDEIELVTDGEYEFSGTSAVFTYMESELTGLEGTRTTFEIENGNVVLSREGTVTSKMLFEEGKKYYFAYETPFGAMTMGVDTHSVVSRLDESGGNIEIRYHIDMDNSPVSRNMFKINIKEC